MAKESELSKMLGLMNEGILPHDMLSVLHLVQETYPIFRSQSLKGDTIAVIIGMDEGAVDPKGKQAHTLSLDVCYHDKVKKEEWKASGRLPEQVVIKDGEQSVILPVRHLYPGKDGMVH